MPSSPARLAIDRGGSGSVIGVYIQILPSPCILLENYTGPLFAKIDSIDPTDTPVLSDTMSQLETLSAHNAIDFSLSDPSRHEFSHFHDDNAKWDANILVNDILSFAPSTRINANTESYTVGEKLFPSLPPLLSGHPEVHMRNGVMNASRLTAAHEPDAEKAFFVADLSQVFRQHQRWVTSLPEIQPFYGSFCGLLHLILVTYHICHSCQMQSRPICHSPACRAGCGIRLCF